MPSILDLVRPTPESIQQMIMQQQLAKRQSAPVDLSQNGNVNPDYNMPVTLPRRAPVPVAPAYEPTSGSRMEAESRSSIDDLMGQLVAQREKNRAQDATQQWMSFFSKMASSNNPRLLGSLGEGAAALTETRGKQIANNQVLDQALLQDQIKAEQWKQEQERQAAYQQGELRLRSQALEQGKYTITPDGLGGFIKINNKTGETETVNNAAENVSTSTVDDNGNQLTGDDYLKTIDSRIAKTAKMVANGDMPWPSGFALKSPYWQNVIAAAQTYDPSANGNRFLAVKAFNTGKQGDTVRSFDVAIDHLNTLGNLSDALKNNDTKALNTISNVWAEQTGKTAPSNFNAAKTVVADEIVKAVIGSGSGALGDREEIKKTIMDSKSPEQLSGTINAYKKLMGGQIGGLKQQYENSTGKKDFVQRISPQSRSEVERLLAELDKENDKLSGAESKKDETKPDKASDDFSHLWSAE